MKPIPLLGAAAALFLGVLAGCGTPSSGGAETKSASSSQGAASSDKPLRLAVIPKGSTHEFWKSVEAGAKEAAADLGNVEIIWKGPLKEDDRESQVKTVEDFITKGVDGIVLAPLDDTALVRPVEEATRSNIPVVIIDSALNGGETVSFVATDNEKGGQTAGEELGRLLGGKGRVVILRYQEGSASTEAREKGFLDAIKKFPGIQVLRDNQYGGATVETAQKASENLLAPYRKGDGIALEGIYCPNESTTFGMLRVLQDAGLAGKLKFVGFDSSTKLLEGLRANQINALVIQNPRKMGYLGVKTLVEKLRGKTVESRIDTGAALITSQNVDSDENKKLLTPP